MANDPQKLFDAAGGKQTTESSAVLHVRVQGRSRDISLDLLDIDPGSSDETVKNAVANFMEMSPELLKNTVVERHENGNMTLRPEAVFG